MRKLLLLIPLLLVGCDEQTPLPKNEVSNHLKIVERGILNGYSYSILEEKATGRKLFAYSYNGMIWLDSTNAVGWPKKIEDD